MYIKILDNVKRNVASLIATLMLMTTVMSIPANAETGITVLNYDTYRVEYNVVSEWDGYQNIEVKLTNTGTEPIYNWALGYDAGGEILNAWSGIVFDSKGTNYIIKNAGYNYEILPNASVNFGYTLKGNNLITPGAFELCSKRVNVTDGYSVQLAVNEQWENGFTGYIEINNESDIVLEAWKLSFATNFVITDLWNANMSQNNENSYTLSSQIMSNPIQPHTSVRVGISADFINNVPPTIIESIMSIVQIDKTILNGNNDDTKDDIIK